MNNSSKARNRLRLSPLEKEILWTLQEAGEENLSALLNTVEPLVSLPPGVEFLPACKRAIKNLLDLKYIGFCIEQEDHARHNLLPVTDEVDLDQALHRTNGGQWLQNKSWDSRGRIVVVQLVDNWA